MAPDYRDTLRQIVDEYKDVFHKTLPKGRPTKRDIVHGINTILGIGQVSRPPYQLSLAERDEIEAQVKDLLAQGFIRPSIGSNSAPILFVPKRNGR